MTEPSFDLETAGVSLTLEPGSVRLDEMGRVQLANARVLSALLSARPTGRLQAEDQNLALCGGNGYQCACPGSVALPGREPT
jgi:hypothetical protein